MRPVVGHTCHVQEADFLSRCRSLWHVSPPGAWATIRRLGFRTAEQLIRAADLDESTREALLIEPRRSSRTLTVEGQQVTIRDQGRLFQRTDLAAVLDDDITVSDWVRLLNQRVYVFTDRKARDALLEKYVQLDGSQDVLTFSPLRLYEAARSRLELTSQNTGSIARRSGPQKGWNTVIPVSQFPADRKPSEVTIRDGLDDLAVVVEVHRFHADGSRERIDITPT